MTGRAPLFFIPPFLLLILVSFQNCSQGISIPGLAGAASASKGQGASNGGDGYTGNNGDMAKTFINRNEDPACSGVQSVIEYVPDKGYFLTRDKCRDLLTPQALTAKEVQALPHDSFNLIKKKKLYEWSATPFNTMILCRRLVADRPTFVTYADIAIRRGRLERDGQPTIENTVFGSSLIARYDKVTKQYLGKTYFGTHQNSPVVIEREAGKTVYRPTDPGELWRLELRDDQLRGNGTRWGQMVYFAPEKGGWFSRNLICHEH